MSPHVQVAGEGPRVLLIQGVGVAGCGWAPQVRGLQDDFTLAWFDNPGIGATPGPAGTVAHMADAARQVLDGLGWDRAHVVGHSLGGMVAQRLALDGPDRVESLALLCTFASGSATLSMRPGALWLQLRTTLGTAEMRRRAFFELVSPRSLAPTAENIEQLEQAFGRRLHDLPSAARAQVLALVRCDHRAELEALRSVPTLVVSATEDRLAPVSQGALLAELLQTELLELPGGHALPVQDAAVVNGLLRDHWTERRPLPATSGVPLVRTRDGTQGGR